jgi:hypothetical protein
VEFANWQIGEEDRQIQHAEVIFTEADFATPYPAEVGQTAVPTAPAKLTAVRETSAVAESL